MSSLKEPSEAPTGVAGDNRDLAVKMRGMVKRFPGVLACDRVDFDLRKGECHALLGENGAGKSTLMKLLAGLHPPDRGEIILRGRSVRFSSPRQAVRQGIGMVYQQFKLSEKHTALENILLADDDLPFWLGRDTGREAVVRTMETLGLEVDLDRPIWQLPVGQRQRVEIIKAVHSGARVLILDEPTAVLGPHETPLFFEVLDSMKREGFSLVFISHKLEEVLAVADRVSVLRQGRNVITVDRADCDARRLAELMVGGQLPEPPPPREIPVTEGPPALEIRGLEALSDRGIPALRGVDLQVVSGEIHGIAGVGGNGQIELAEVIGGMRTPTGGEVLFSGSICGDWCPRDRIRRGVRFVPADRHGMGTAPDMDIAENLLLKQQRLRRFSASGMLKKGAVYRHAEQKIADHRIEAASAEVKVRTLSGGNLQKVILARETDGNPSLLLATYPSRGLDVGAVSALHGVFRSVRDRGAAVLLISEELEELLAVCDRISVIFSGRIVLSRRVSELSAEEVGAAMGGRIANESDDDATEESP